MTDFTVLAWAFTPLLLIGGLAYTVLVFQGGDARLLEAARSLRERRRRGRAGGRK